MMELVQDGQTSKAELPEVPGAHRSGAQVVANSQGGVELGTPQHLQTPEQNVAGQQSQGDLVTVATAVAQ